jgi:signal peptide peptidase SppA
MTSTDEVAAAVRRAAADSNVTSIVLLVDSPGGGVMGVQECADVVYAARKVKPVVAVADSLAASAAFWIASQASEVVVTPGGMVGSVGVVGVHEDHSEELAKEGVKVSLVSAGRFKTEANEYEPLDAAAREEMQKTCDAYYSMFVAAVARGRKVSVEKARGAAFGEGRVVMAADAVKRGMADRVATLYDVLAEIGPAGKRPRTAALLGKWEQLRDAVSQ